MLIGYMRVSKADGSQTNDLQRDALIAVGVDATHLYEDRASGKREDRPGLVSSANPDDIALNFCCWIPRYKAAQGRYATLSV